MYERTIPQRNGQRTPSAGHDTDRRTRDEEMDEKKRGDRRTRPGDTQGDTQGDEEEKTEE